MGITVNENFSDLVEQSISRFHTFLSEYGFLSYDHYDFWASKAGILSKKIYYKKKWLGAPFVIGFQLLESFFPSSRYLFAKKHRFAIGDAHYILGYLNLYRISQESEYLELAKELCKTLISYGTRTQSGIGWGYPYVWVSRRADYPIGTPYITVTPYCFQALLDMHSIEPSDQTLETAHQIAEFAAHDLIETKISQQSTASSYSPLDNSKVINANTYRAALLLSAESLFNEGIYREKAVKNIQFVLDSQNPDGSWYYAAQEPFIDNFHTCFVLKNLYQCYAILKEESILNAIKKGYDYYRKSLFRPDNTPIHFSKTQTPKFRKIELYDYAEGISLGVQLRDDIPEALEFAKILTNDLIHKFQLPKGHFVSRVNTLRLNNKIPYLRWPQAQLFYALTKMLRYLKRV